MILTPDSIEPNRLLLDPNNYRFHDISSYRPVLQRERYGDQTVQNRAIDLLQNTEKFDLQALKDSITTNGYVPLEHIVVEEYDQDQGGNRFLVVEGNRRVAAVKLLIDEVSKAVVDISDDKLATLAKLPVYVIGGSREERASFRQTLMAIRHVAGITEWGPYQQAKLVKELFEQEDHKFGKVAQRIGIKPAEVGRRYRAIKALQQMENDEEFGDYADPKLYALFQEAISAPNVRTWLGWSDQSFTAENDETRHSFYELLISRRIDGETRQPKVDDVRQVRELKNIVNKDYPLSILLDPERSFQDAVDAARSEIADLVPGLLEHSILQAIRSLKEPRIDAWLTPSDRARDLWSQLVNIVEGIRGYWEKGDQS